MLFTTTVFENISYGSENATQEEVQEAALAANAHEFICRLPQGYDTPVTDSTLSGGQRQRIAIARALFRKPRMLVRAPITRTPSHNATGSRVLLLQVWACHCSLHWLQLQAFASCAQSVVPAASHWTVMLQILDEATSALDSATESAVQQTLDYIVGRRNLIVVIIAHRLATVMNCDNIVVMDKGQVVEMGSHEQLLARGELYASLVAQQSLGDLTTCTDSDDTDEDGIADDTVDDRSTPVML